MNIENKQQEAVNQLYDWIAHRLIKDKKSKEEVAALLMEQGISSETAIRMVGEVEDEWKTRKLKKSKRDMILGGVVCMGGVIASSVDSFEVYWMVVLVGVAMFIRGASNC
jgi:uncharacterized protein YoaH (UPF0181 family)